MSKNLGLFAAASPALEAAMAAAAKVADAEAKAHDAHDQMMEAERIIKMAEETECLLTIAAIAYDRCMSSLFHVIISLCHFLFWPGFPEPVGIFHVIISLCHFLFWPGFPEPVGTGPVPGPTVRKMTGNRSLTGPKKPGQTEPSGVPAGLPGFPVGFF
jgi:hypothetical protein